MRRRASRLGFIYRCVPFSSSDRPEAQLRARDRPRTGNRARQNRMKLPPAMAPTSPSGWQWRSQTDYRDYAPRRDPIATACGAEFECIFRTAL